MKNTGVWIGVVILGIAVVGGVVVGKIRWDQAQRTPEMIKIEEMYKVYLADRKQISTAQLVSQFFTKDFQKLWQENTDKCSQLAGGDVCGLGSGGDFLLNSQEVDPLLDYENSKFRVLKFENGFIEAHFNVYPNQLKAGKLDPAYDRRIRFFMTQENGQWLIDDLAYIGSLGPVSVRDSMKEEIQFLEKSK